MTTGTEEIAGTVDEHPPIAMTDDDPPAIDDDPVHLARCAECATAVKFRPNVTGTGFLLVDAGPDETFGVGPNGRPMCPQGHGEMAIADDRLMLVPEAFADAQTMLVNAEREAVQRTLPGVIPDFNFQGAYLELEEKAAEVDALHKDYTTAAEEARDAKKAWDKAAELYTKMALEFRRRRREKADGPAVPFVPDSPRGVTCTWEAAHPTETCPMCSGATVEAVLARLVGNKREAPDAEAHVDEVDGLIAGLELEETVEALQAIDTYIEPGIITAWSPEDRQAVTTWARSTFDAVNEGTLNVVVPDRPAVLGKPHIPAEAVDGRQVCTLCDEVLVKSSQADDHYRATDLIGTDCAGKKKPEGHRYPARGKSSKKVHKRPAKSRN